MNKIITILLIICFTLSGCTGDRCIDADDFGFAKVVVSSRYTSGELSLQQNNQISPWRNSGFTVNGRPLMILVKTWQYGIEKNNAGELSAWCPWYGAAGNENTLSRFCERLTSCMFTDGRMCSSAKDANISNAPCLLKNGIGLYALIAAQGTDPNASFVTERFPDGITFHLGDRITGGYSLYDVGNDGSQRIAGGLVYNYQIPGQDGAAVKQQYAGSGLYFKILDKFYDDNSGQYKVVIKSGVNDEKPDPIQYLTGLIRDYLFGTGGSDYGLIKNIYINITQNVGYQLAVSGLLSLYIMFTALSFLTGNLNITHTELIIRVIKIGVVSALLNSRYSWDFFNNYLFAYFVGGVNQILQIIQDAGATGPGSASILNLLIAPQTMAKLFSLLFIDWRGFIYIFLFLIAMFVLFKIFFEASVIYLSALIMIGMIITMAPIFICFMLFQITRSLFENWLKQIITYSLQPIILFTGLIFISMIMRAEIYSSLGFRVCKHDFPDLGGSSNMTFDSGIDSSLSNSLFYWWIPVSITQLVKASIPIPQDFVQADGTFCEAYGCIGERYIQLPFLDPNRDINRINNFFQGNFVQLDGLWAIFIAIYLLIKFNEFSLATAKFIAGSSGTVDIGAASGAAVAPVNKFLHKPIDRFEAGVNRVKNRVSGTIGAGYEALMTNSLRKDALAGANKAVLDEVKRNYGMDYQDLNKNASKDYLNALKEQISKVDPSIKGAEFERKASQLAQKDYKDLPEELRNAKLKKLASDVKFARDFQEAYVDAHQAMSERGIGFFGKRISALRSLEELQHNIKTQEETKQEKSKNIGRKIYAGYDGIKRALVTGLVGEKLRDSLEGSLTGAASHDFDYNDPALRTYSEQLQDKERNLKYQELTAQINKETINARQDVLRPEYLAALERSGRIQDAKYYRGLAQQKLENEVYNALSGGEDPALMGARFMREKATDSQSRHMIDRAYEIRNDLIENDRYIRRESGYEATQEEALETIKQKYQMLKDAKVDNITVERMPMLLEAYYNQNAEIDLRAGKDEKTVQAKRDEGKKAAQEFMQAVQDFKESQRMLSEVNSRKSLIEAEVDKHVDWINRHRKEAQMPEYKTEAKTEVRKLHTLEDHLKKW